MQIFRRLLPLLLLVLAAATAGAQEAYNTTLFDKLNPAAAQGGRYSALTGYVAPDGREYALLGGFTGTHIIDVTTKPIRQVAFIPGPNSGWREMKTYGSTAYVVSEGGGGLQIIDLSELPVRATLVESDTRYIDQAHTITQEGHWLYINGSYKGDANGGTLIFDISPDNEVPKLVGKWTDRYVHDCTIRNDTMYAAAINDGQLDIIYLGKDRSAPRFITEIRYAGAGTHNSDLTANGRYIVTTDEIGSTAKTLKFWDRSNMESITKVADYTAVPGEIVHNIHIKGDYAYVAWYTAGTRIIDISNPREPVEVGYYDTFEGAANDYDGNWGTYPYLPSGKIISSDMQTGLYVFTFDGGVSGSVHGLVLDSATGRPIPKAFVEFPEIGKTIRADAQGRFKYAGAVDTLEYRAYANNYQIGSGTVILSPEAAAADQNILLRSFPVVNLSLKVVDATSGASLDGFTYTVVERRIESVSEANPQVLVFPQDSGFTIMVGAWGYKPQTIHPNNLTSEIVEVRLARGYSDDARLDLGWIFGTAVDDATAGTWERGATVETIAQPKNDRSASDDNYAFVTGIANSTAGAGANDIDGGSTTLTSPEFDLASYGDPYLNVSIWYSNNGNPDAPVDDHLLLQISNDGGVSWHELETLD